MSDVPTNEPDQPSKKGSGWLGSLVKFIVMATIVFMMAMSVYPGCVGLYGDPKRKKTEYIIQTINTGIELEIANKGSVQSSFDGLCKAFHHSSTFEDLMALKAIDQERRCFVDGWGNPISITIGENNSIVLSSAGKDGILGNKDDVR